MWAGKDHFNSVEIDGIKNTRSANGEPQQSRFLADVRVISTTRAATSKTRAMQISPCTNGSESPGNTVGSLVVGHPEKYPHHKLPIANIESEAVTARTKIIETSGNTPTCVGKIYLKSSFFCAKRKHPHVAWGKR